MSSMSGRYFLDTNILVYTFDPSQPEKQDRARRLVEEALRSTEGVISSQVVQEFLNVATRRFETPLTPADCRVYLDTVLAPLCDVFPTIELYKDALSVHEGWRFSLYDSLIVAAALATGCERLYTEDLQDGQRVRDLVIENPFRPTD
jgi:predicted nucleic acid-binding protein